MMAEKQLAGKAIEHSSIIDWAKKLIARYMRGEPVSKDDLNRARAVVKHAALL